MGSKLCKNDATMQTVPNYDYIMHQDKYYNFFQILQNYFKTFDVVSDIDQKTSSFHPGQNNTT